MSSSWQTRWDSLFAGCFPGPDALSGWRVLQPSEPDGNPILMRACDRLGRAVRVLLRANDEGRPFYPAGGPPAHDTHFLPFDAWLETLHDTSGTRGYAGLTVSADLSAPALAMARELIVMHCVENRPARDMQGWIEDYYAQLDARGYGWT